MQEFKLKNGLSVVYDSRDSPTIAIEICVGTGSNNEPRNIAGISHFLEHMVFEGTTTRTSKEISEAIENIGGEINAATSNERTFFYVKIPKDKFSLGIEILSDIMKNPAFEPKILEKERNVILEEIRMVNDQPMMYQWVLFEKNIFKRHPTRNPVYGRVESVKATTRDQMLDYYKTWYVPNNMTVSVVGKVDGLKRIVEEKLGSCVPKAVPKIKRAKEPKDTKPTIVKEKQNTNQAYLTLGYKTVPRAHPDSFVLDVISAVFSKGISGRINEEIRLKRGLAYSVGAISETKKDYGFFVFHLNCDRKNLALCKSIILQELKKLSNLGEQELKYAKEHIIGREMLELEDSQKRADELAFWKFIKDASYADKYCSIIKKVTRADVLRVSKKFFDGNYTMAVLSK